MQSAERILFILLSAGIIAALTLLLLMLLTPMPSKAVILDGAKWVGRMTGGIL